LFAVHGIKIMTSNNSAVIDLTAIAQLREIDGTGQLLMELVKLYAANSAQLLREMQQSVQAGELAATGAAAHSLKSSSGNLGAQTLREFCAQIEAAAKRGDAASAQALVSGAAQTQASTLAALQKLIAA
jgi:HPt (histidine-containing phosphotransfer) domain-containing protein